MFIADMYYCIHDTDEYPLEDGMVETLDKMLNDNGIRHSFALPTNEIIDRDETISLLCLYDSDDDMTFFLTYALWCKTVRKCDDEKIKKAMLKHMAGD